MPRQRVRSALLTIALASAPAAAPAACRLELLATLPVTMQGRTPLLAARIDGTETQLLLDSGAFYGTLTRAATNQLKLPLELPPVGFHYRGAGGPADAWITRVRDFEIGGERLAYWPFIVGGLTPAAGIAGALGQDVLGQSDVEYDLPHGLVRLFRPHGCDNTVLAYWAGTRHVSTLAIDGRTAQSSFTTANLQVDGAGVHALFDTGTTRSYLTLQGAQRSGLGGLGSAAQSVGALTGTGERSMKFALMPVASVKIGDEEIRHTQLGLADVADPSAFDMFIGIDFFLSHRLYVANSQDRLYFTYEGGPVFDIEPMNPALSSSLSKAPLPTDAAGLERLGAALAARGDYADALSDLTRACQLAPGQSQYFYERGLVYRSAAQALRALTDFDQAVALDATNVPARLARAQLRLVNRQRAGALADLGVIDHLLAPDDVGRLQLAELYLRVDRLHEAIAQYDLWIPTHGDDGRQADALSGRCRARALADEQLDKALADCNRALRLRPGAWAILNSRGLLQLRARRLDQSIADFSAVLQQRPNNAVAFYGRGLAEIRKGLTGPGRQDMHAALTREPAVAERFELHGLAP
ncbi:MAG TPA: aspartyl protease family protein [Steroidobacteraceae bacterium]|nr:aspartyl protease family protein [Steroidobacteraceae bacterium]